MALTNNQLRVINKLNMPIADAIAFIDMGYWMVDEQHIDGEVIFTYKSNKSPPIKLTICKEQENENP